MVKAGEVIVRQDLWALPHFTARLGLEEQEENSQQHMFCVSQLEFLEIIMLGKVFRGSPLVLTPQRWSQSVFEDNLMSASKQRLGPRDVAARKTIYW